VYSQVKGYLHQQFFRWSHRKQNDGECTVADL
jgi:hypothetical protein